MYTSGRICVVRNTGTFSFEIAVVVSSLVVIVCLSARDLMELDVERRKTAGKDASTLDYTPVVGSCVCIVMLYV